MVGLPAHPRRVRLRLRARSVGTGRFRIRATRDPVQIRTLLDVSSLAIGVMYIGLLLLLIGGIAAGIVGRPLRRAAGSGPRSCILVVITVAMYAMATPFYGQLRVAAGARAKDPKADPNPVVNQAEIDALAGSNRPAVLLAIGAIGFLVILWLMVLKPF